MSYDADYKPIDQLIKGNTKRWDYKPSILKRTRYNGMWELESKKAGAKIPAHEVKLLIDSPAHE